MSMKKKFLALALAGAVVLPMTVNATTMQSYEGPSSSPINADVDINGTVSTNTGLTPAGKIHVELPTAMAFTVDNVGTFIASNRYTVENKGTDSIKIDIAEFSETKTNTNDPGLTVEQISALDQASEQSTKDRSHVALQLEGDHTVDLKTVTPQTPSALFDEIKGGSSRNIVLSGFAGTNTTSGSSQSDAVKDGASEDFVVKFKISKK